MSVIHPVLNPARVRSDLSRLGRESEQYLSTVESFHDDEFDKPSHCEGWNRAMVIAHDLAVVREIAHDVCVMEKGRLVETGTVDSVFENPQQEYTRRLLDAIPGKDLLEV